MLRAVIGIVFVAPWAARADSLLGSSGLFDQGTSAFYNVYTLSPANPSASSLTYTNLAGGPSTFNLSDPGTAVLSGSYQATGEATYGQLDAKISADVSGASSFPLITIYSSEFFFDSLTFYTNSNQSTGTAYLSVSVDGSGSFSGSNAGVYGQNYATVLAGEAGTSTFHRVASGQATFLSQPIPFTSGVPVSIEVALAANEFFGCKITNPDPAECDSWSATGVTDYSHTAILTGIELFDSTGAPINTFQISSASGTAYGPDGVVPEPNTLVLCLSIIVVFGAFRHRSKCKTIFRART